VLRNKIVVVSGAGQGLGREIAIRSALPGADIVVAADGVPPFGGHQGGRGDRPAGQDVNGGEVHH
jgi:NAD(P)-dependent dehydrogenase (short-subunit alcohol dehydrogenase family)